jgi:hypothetical protein
MRERVFVSIKGSPFARFQRALDAANLNLALLAAVELERVPLAEAVRLCELMAASGDPRFERAAVRWVARLASETLGVRLADVELAAHALERMPVDPEPSLGVLAALGQRLGLPGAARIDPRRREPRGLPPG